MPNSFARVTARLEGAPTAMTNGTPATAAFCMISKLAPPLTARIRSDSGRESRAHDVVLWRHAGFGAVLDACEVPLPGDDPFRQEESGRELEVVSRRPHRYGERRGGVAFPAVLHADLQRLLRRETVA